jgi:hypothetical protein
MQTLERVDKLILLKSPPYFDLYNQLKTLITSVEYKHVTPEDALAVCQVESQCDPIFRMGDPLFAANLDMVLKTTNLPRQMLGEAILIRKGPLIGQMAKFRFEPTYWTWAQKQKLNSVQLMLMMSCSFGLAQQMTRWIVGENRVEEWTSIVENFKADTGLQLRWLIGNLDKLLANNDNNLVLAYAAYNCGNPHTEDKTVLLRAENVSRIRDGIREQLTGEDTKCLTNG